MRYADGIIDRARNRIISVREDHTVKTGQAVTTIVSLGLDKEGEGKILVSGNDFYSTPRLSPDGSKLASLTWNHPNMPWDGTELWVADVKPDGSLGKSEKVAGGLEESIYQPEWSPDGMLYFSSDRTGWWNLYRQHNNQIEPLYPMEAEFGLPQWQFGSHTFVFDSSNHIICAYTKDGLWHLASLNPTKTPEYEAPEGERPPLLVVSHGGPTSASPSILRYEIQYWTSRGIGVVDVNYGGSTGYGRDYRLRLNDNWGIVDVQDCVNATRYLASRRQADGERLGIRGGSAGGYTTLCALAFTATFKAGASYFGVSDLELLAKDTHKFESRYLDRLVGPYPERRDIYRARSPIDHVDGISSALILFQGLEDKVVPPDQSEKIFEAVKAKGLPVAYIAYEWEQHGFRRAENIKRSYEAELYFYSKIFRFNLADQIEPVTIENLDVKETKPPDRALEITETI